jgi:hypothetical protein
MKLAQSYSHLNGLEFLLVHKQALWNEVQAVIEGIDAEACKTKVSKDKEVGRRIVVQSQGA